MPTSQRSKLQGSPFVRLAGLSGASAVAFSFYGTFLYNNEKKEKRTLAEMRLSSENLNQLLMKQKMQKWYDETNKIHFFHTFALLAAPLANKPALTGTLMIGATTLYCGSGYYYAFKGPQSQSDGYTPVVVANNLGAFMIIVAWLTFVL